MLQRQQSEWIIQGLGSQLVNVRVPVLGYLHNEYQLFVDQRIEVVKSSELNPF